MRVLVTGGLVFGVGTSVGAEGRFEEGSTAAGVEVFYSGRGCASRVLEVETWSGSREAWAPHPEHPRVVADSCVEEKPGAALHEIRVRCVDPSGRSEPGPWRVGVGLGDAGGVDRCADRSDDVDGAGISISSPDDGSEVTNEAGEVLVEGRAGFEVRESVGYEIVVVIDVSGSTAQPSGIDVDGDGLVGEPLGRPPAVFSSDSGDSVLAAEIQAVRLLLSRLEAGLGATRVALVSFSGETVMGEGGGAFTTRPAVRVELPLTSEIARLSSALDEVFKRGSVGGTNFYAAVERSLVELSGHWSAQSNARENASKIIVLLTDGVPSPPLPGSAYDDPSSRARAVMATRGAKDAGVAIHIYALGGRADEFPRFVRALLQGSAGSFTRVRNPGDTASFLGDLQLASVREVKMKNLTTGTPGAEVVITPDGHFQGKVPVHVGPNSVLVTARSADGRERRKEFEFTYVKPSEREALLQAERERVDRLRRQRKQVRIESEAETKAGTPAPDEAGTGAP